MCDKDRLENLQLALHTQVDLLKYAYDIKDYMRMIEYSSNIEKLSYTITYLQNNMRMGEK